MEKNPGRQSCYLRVVLSNQWQPILTGHNYRGMPNSILIALEEDTLSVLSNKTPLWLPLLYWAKYIVYLCKVQLSQWRKLFNIKKPWGEYVKYVPGLLPGRVSHKQKWCFLRCFLFHYSCRSQEFLLYRHENLRNRSRSIQHTLYWTTSIVIEISLGIKH